MFGLLLAGVLAFGALPSGVVPAAADPARGEKALLGRAFLPPAWSRDAFDRAWRRWPGAGKARPEPYDRAFMEHYGLHPAPYPNGPYPMGLREASIWGQRGITNDCLVCHAGSVAGRSYVGLGNASLDFQALFEDLNGATGRAPRTPFVFSNVRGTTEAGSMAVYLLCFREPDLRLRPKVELGLRDNLCEDVPAWWLLKKKRTMYYTGSADARSVRSIMQFMLNPLNSAADFRREEPTFRDIQAYLLTLEPPKYPFPIDQELARRGEQVFRANCSRCHGTYGKDWTYPNKVVPIDVIGTDRTRFEGFTAAAGRHYNASWFTREVTGWLADDYPAADSVGYQAPPLDGIWATAPYLHNGSVPTVYDVLRSDGRPKIFTRSYGTDRQDYDPVKLGWKVCVLSGDPSVGLPAFERRKVYDTTQPGRGNGGHRFGDHLTDRERWAVVEYLKTL